MEICRKVGLDAAQLHGDEPPLAVDAVQGVRRIKAIRVASEADIALCRRYRVEAFLLDAYDPGRRGGTGRTFDWKLARAAAQFGPIILAGGLTADNVAEAIAAAAPYGVDVASGIESEPGRKDRAPHGGVHLPRPRRKPSAGRGRREARSPGIDAPRGFASLSAEIRVPPNLLPHSLLRPGRTPPAAACCIIFLEGVNGQRSGGH